MLYIIIIIILVIVRILRLITFPWIFVVILKMAIIIAELYNVINVIVINSIPMEFADVTMANGWNDQMMNLMVKKKNITNEKLTSEKLTSEKNSRALASEFLKSEASEVNFKKKRISRTKNSRALAGEGNFKKKEFTNERSE